MKTTTWDCLVKFKVVNKYLKRFLEVALHLQSWIIRLYNILIIKIILNLLQLKELNSLLQKHLFLDYNKEYNIEYSYIIYMPFNTIAGRKILSIRYTCLQKETIKLPWIPTIRTSQSPKNLYMNENDTMNL